MPYSLNELAAELQFAIIEHLEAEKERETLLNLSLTCSSYRSLLATYVFSTIKLCNTEESGSVINGIANGPYSHLVQALHYSAYAPGDLRGEEAFSDVDGVFPPIIETVLSNLRRFPKLMVLRIEFNFNFGCWNDEWENSIEQFYELESTEDVHNAEENEAWRAAMAKTFTAIARNEAPCVKSLEIRELISKEVSTFQTEAWHNFLGTLDRFDVTIRGDDNGAGWEINTLDSYYEFIKRLDEFFFNHLKNVKELSIQADNSGPLGGEGRYQVPLTLHESQMPLLKKIHLKMVFVCPELAEFIVGHSNTLECVSLDECFAGVNGLCENGMYWAEFFTTLSDIQPRKLQQLDLLPLNRLDPDGNILAQDSPLRLFDYRYLDDKYGMLFEDDMENRESFLYRVDQDAYDRLMHIIEENVMRETLEAVFLGQ